MDQTTNTRRPPSPEPHDAGQAGRAQRLPAAHAHLIDRPRGSDYLSAMTIKPLIILPDPVLRLTSRPVETVDERVQRLADDMLETMYDAPGIGLAAIQVGEPLRMLVIDVSKDDEEKAPRVFINPEILDRSDATNVYEEGCLSIPDYYAEVERPAEVTARYLGLDGEDARGDGGRHPRHLPPARDRPPQRRPVHRPHFEAEARHGGEEVHQGGPPHDGLRRRWLCGSSSWARRTSPCRPFVPFMKQVTSSRRVYTQPPRKAGRRGLSLTPSPVQVEAERLAIDVSTPANFRQEADRAAFAELGADVAVVVAYGLLLPQADPRRAALRLPQRPRARCCRAGAAQRRSSARSRPATRPPA